MSTAGKVLIVLVMLVTLVFIVLGAGVSRLNTSANTRLHELTEQVLKLDGQVKDAQADAASLLTQRQQIQEQTDREYALSRAKQSDVERTRSKIIDTLSAATYELEIINGTVKTAQTDLENRNTEFQEETKRLGADRTQVDELMADCTKLRDRLGSLRTEFESTYHSNIELLGKASKSTKAAAGSTN